MSLRREQLAREERTAPVVGITVLVLIALFVFYVFARPDPLGNEFRIRAVVTSVTGVTPGITPVRIGGVDVGEVAAVQSFRGSRRSIVTLELQDEALPVHTDAEVKMRPRLFLEGNTFVELQPGSPGAPVAKDGATIPLAQTSVAVTMPQVLGALEADTRSNLKDALNGYGAALNDAPRDGAAAAGGGAETGGPTGGQALNEALRHAARAMPTTALLSDAYTGEQPGDLRRAVRAFAEVAGGLNDAGPQLPSMLRSIREANSAFARESASVTAALEELPDALEGSRAALRELRAALPPAAELSTVTADAMPALPAMLDAGVPWLRELGGLLGPAELGADLESLIPATRELAGSMEPLRGALRELELLARCSTHVLIPTANARIEDGPRTAGSSSWGEFLSAVVGANGAAQTFDGNGFMLRGNPGGGDYPIATADTRWGREPIYGNALAPPEGTRPAAPAELPPHRPGVACHTASAPDLNGGAAAAGPADGSGG
jgi:phospholipid/cholesterol/gamma-HCH transport system substrate-binding protein